MQAGEIIRQAAWLLADEGFDRWSREMLVSFLSQGQRQIALLRPEAVARAAVIRLAPGSAQAIPNDGLMLLDVVRNMGADGQTPQGPVHRAEAEALDLVAALPAQTGDAIDCYAVDRRTPRSFRVSPPVAPTAGVHVEIVYAATPAPLTAETDAIGLPEAFAGALLDYVLFRAFSADTGSKSSLARSAAHFEAFRAALSGKREADALAAPK